MPPVPPATAPPDDQQTEQCATGSGQVRKFWLHVLDGPDAGVSFSSRGRRVTVGTATGVDLALHDKAVSKYHCEFEIDQSQVILRDLGSRNGTQVGGVRVREAYLDHGATLTLGRSHLRFELDAALLTVPASSAASFGRLLGGSEAMRQAFALLERAASSAATVLLVGEAGSGKATAAQALHDASGRARGPLLVVDCAATPPALLDAALFGAGAEEGSLEAAAGGTLYLNEVSALPARLQAKLAQALERKLIPLAAGKTAPLQARLLASTRRDLRSEINTKRFLAELYYHLAVIEIRLPPLRERPDDIAPLVARFAAELAPDEPPFPAEQLDDLRAHSWPGNVRELRAHVERCVALGHRAPLAPEAFPEGAGDIDPSLPLRDARERWVESFERLYLTRQLALHGNSVSAAARASGVDRVHFYRLLWRHGLK